MLEWTSEETALLNSVPVRQIHTDYASHPTTEEAITVLKGRAYFDDYAALCPAPRNILEVGIFEGGSAMILAETYPGARISALDIRRANPAVLQHLGRMGLSDRVSLHYGVSQADEAAVLRAMGDLDAPPDLVIDDASHDYELTKRTFEIVFPRLCPGALYVIEDWAWAHWPGAGMPAWRGPTLSNLVFELAVATASRRPLVESLTVNSRFTVVTRGSAPIGPTLNLLEALNFGGRKWVRLGES